MDYYLIALGKSFGSASGAANQLVNFGYRYFSYEDAQNYYEMAIAIEAEDTDTIGKCTGTFLSKLLMVEVPDTTSLSNYQNVGTLM